MTRNRAAFLAHNAAVSKARLDHESTPNEFAKPSYCVLCTDHHRAGSKLCLWCREAAETRLMVATSVGECAELLYLLEPLDERRSA